MSKTGKKRKWIRWGLAALAGVVLLIVAGKYLIIPAVIRSVAGEALAQRWRGEIDITSIDFNYFGPVELRGIRVRDEQDRTWVSVANVQADWTFLGLFSPALSELRVQDPHLHAFVKDGKVDWPLRPAQQEEPTEPMRRLWPQGLESVVIRNFRMTVHEESGQVRQVKPGDLELVREGDNVRTHFQIHELPEDQRIELTGHFGATDNLADLQLELHRRFPAPWSRFLLALLEVPHLRSAYGLVTTRSQGSQVLRIRGDLLSASDLSILGQIGMKDWLVHTEYGQLLRNGQTQIVLNEGTDLSGNTTRVIKIRETAADAGDGTVGMRESEIVLAKDWSLHKLNVLAHMDSQLGHFMRALGRGDQKGRLSFTSSLRNDKIGLEGLKGEVAVRLDNGQLMGIPIVSSVFNYLRAEEFNPVTLSDALGEFQVSWPYVTVGQFRVASKLYAIEFRKGGRVNLDTGQIDNLRVVAVPLQKVGGVLDRIPGFQALSSLPTELTKNITQLEVTGNVLDSGSIGVRPVVGAELAGETFDFLKRAAASGGNLLDQAGSLGSGGILPEGSD